MTQLLGLGGGSRSHPWEPVWVEATGQVVGPHRDLLPWPFGRFYRRARFVIELPSGAVETTRAELGHCLGLRELVARTDDAKSLNARLDIDLHTSTTDH